MRRLMCFLGWHHWYTVEGPDNVGYEYRCMHLGCSAVKPSASRSLWPSETTWYEEDTDGND